jgi:hypothetical protein
MPGAMQALIPGAAWATKETVISAAASVIRSMLFIVELLSRNTASQIIGRVVDDASADVSGTE